MTPDAKNPEGGASGSCGDLSGSGKTNDSIPGTSTAPKIQVKISPEVAQAKRELIREFLTESPEITVGLGASCLRAIRDADDDATLSAMRAFHVAADTAAACVCADRREPLVILPLRFAIEVAVAAGRAKG
jgi:hypothetical protein